MMDHLSLYLLINIGIFVIFLLTGKLKNILLPNKISHSMSPEKKKELSISIHIKLIAIVKENNDIIYDVYVIFFIIIFKKI